MLPNHVTVQELAKSARCTLQTVRDAIKRGDLEAVAPVGNRLLIKEEHALAWLERKPSDTGEEELATPA